jgi:hypothetical protein
MLNYVVHARNHIQFLYEINFFRNIIECMENLMNCAYLKVGFSDHS